MKELDSVSGVIFDVDGTLVDSNDYHAKAFEEAFRVSGHNVDFRTIRPLIGMGAEKLIPRALGRPCSEKELEAIGELKSTLFLKKQLAEVRPFPKVIELMQSLKDRGKRLAIASSADEAELWALLRVAGVESYFDGVATAEDAERSKPAPDIVEAAIAKLGGAKERIVLIGDTPYDVEAATLAGIRSIGLRSGGWSDASLWGATQLYDGIWDLYDTLENVDAASLTAERTPDDKKVAFGGMY